jgi:hypothetical protein
MRSNDPMTFFWLFRMFQKIQADSYVIWLICLYVWTVVIFQQPIQHTLKSVPESTGID